MVHETSISSSIFKRECCFFQIKNRDDSGTNVLSDIFEREQKKKKSVYIRDRALFGLSKWLHMPSAALFFLRNKSHPLEFEEGSPRKDKLPILLFSHGIGGNCEIYSQLCADIADAGFVVVALEHEDGSASYAMNSNGEEIFYKFPPKDMPYTRNKVVKFREPFLEQRKREVESAFEHMKMLSESKDATHPFKRIADVVDFDRVAIGGHSFGGASTIHLNASSSSVLKPRCVLLHDPWPFCVSEKDINQGLNRPTLCMVGDRFRNSPEYAITEDLIEQTRRKNRVKVYSSSRSRCDTFTIFGHAVLVTHTDCNSFTVQVTRQAPRS